MGFGVSSAPPSCQTCGCAEDSCEGCRTPADCSTCASCCCNDSHQSWRRLRIRNGIQVEYLSSAWMIVEVLGSIGFGVMSGSFALLAFGGDSLVELVSGIAVLATLHKESSRAVARDGVHGKASERLTNALLFTLVPIIGLGSILSYVTGLRPEGSLLGIVVAVGAVI